MVVLEGNKKICNKDIVAYMLWIVIGIFAFFSFYFRYDSGVLIVSGNLLLDGHLIDYYEQMEGIIGDGGVYPILLPIIYAIWNLPIRIFTMKSFVAMSDIPLYVLLWNKIMVTLVWGFTGKVLGQITGKLQENSRLKNMWYYMPISFLVVWMMGTYDIFYVSLMTLGLRYYFSDWENEGRKNKYVFILCYGVSICFKTLPVFYFIPLLLAKEKKIRSLIVDMALFAIPYVLCAVPFLPSEAFIDHCLKFSGRSSGMLLVSMFGNIVPLIVILLIIYGYSYFNLGDGAEFEKNIIYICNLVSCVIFGLSAFHPQWFLMAMPFFVLLMVYTVQDRIDVVLILHVLMTLAYFMIFAAKKDYIDSSYALLEQGIFGYEGLDLCKRNDYVSLLHFYRIDNLGVICSVFLGVMLCIVLFSYGKEKQHVTHIARTRLLAMFLASLGVFILPAVCCYMPIFDRFLYASELSYTEDSSAILLNQNDVAEYFTQDNEFGISRIIFRTFTWDNTYESEDTLTVRLRKSDSADVLFEKQILLNDLPNNELVAVDVPDLKLGQGTYAIEFSAEASDENKAVGISKRKIDEENGQAYLTVNGDILQGEDLQIQIISR